MKAISARSNIGMPCYDSISHSGRSSNRNLQRYENPKVGSQQFSKKSQTELLAPKYNLRSDLILNQKQSPILWNSLLKYPVLTINLYYLDQYIYNEEGCRCGCTEILVHIFIADLISNNYCSEVHLIYRLWLIRRLYHGVRVVGQTIELSARRGTKAKTKKLQAFRFNVPDEEPSLTRRPK